MKDLIRKGMRLQKPRELKVSIRPCVFDWLEEEAEKLRCSYNVLARGILEDAYDRYHDASPSEEVSGND